MEYIQKLQDPLEKVRKTNLENREKIINDLRIEFMGAEPYIGEEIDCDKQIHFEKESDAYKPYIQKGLGQEIIQKSTPLRRYGTAILFPTGQPQVNGNDNIIKETQDIDDEGYVDEQLIKELEDKEVDYKDDTHDDFDISRANSFRPSSMALSFQAEVSHDSKLVVSVTGGRYSPKTIIVANKEREWWLRKPISVTFVCSGYDLLNNKVVTLMPEEPMDGLDLEVKVISRIQEDGTRLMTVSLTNRTEVSSNGYLDSFCLFQSKFIATVLNSNNTPSILPYPEGDIFEKLDKEEQSIAMLYRNLKTYAIGHGCAADWGELEGGKVYSVNTEFLPTYETRSMTPEIQREDGSKIEVSMKVLAGLDPQKSGFEELEEIINLYRQWIEKQRKRIPTLDEKFRIVASQNLKTCEECVARMEGGLKYLKTDKNALHAFRLANYAILLQQITGEKRSGIDNGEEIVFDSLYKEPDVNKLRDNKGNWRAFQIAFILMSLKSVGEKESEEREIVDLIFFPTGGGKTEAYLGLAAFSMFIRRIKNKNDNGVDVLMRYTLRLLTADQFQRSSRLICAMEYLRKKNQELLGEFEFSIGIWLGGDTTPNSNKNAVTALRKIKSGKSDGNPFILRSCPWCGAEMGTYKVENKVKKPTRIRNRRGKQSIKVYGYKDSVDKVILYCPDNKCQFHNHLPIYLVDEEIYMVRPTFIIGTVDKFAMLAWNSEIRSLFGINDQGERETSPPGLIIQDELHLISGPLGSMTGFFETIIEELCTDRRVLGREVRPKIVCSTATIRRYKEQVKSLYAREEVRLFPPPALDEDDSFFATYAVDEKGRYMPGREYLGINAPILGSMQTVQVRALSSLLQAPMDFESGEKDPWWTLLLFFNSLRELGTTISLLHSDIPNHLKVLQNRFNLDFDGVRKLKWIEELTSRLSNDEVTMAIDKLKQEYDGSSKAIDISLASNIIEVGIDIDRLSLMSVVGQPKTTAQYIQVTGRVGRRWYERPGLIVTLYSATKPRDRSHFEKFRSYHQMLYAQVEPTSVTPFSPRVIDRALHAIMVAYVRQFGNKEEVGTPRPFPEDLLSEIEAVILKRVKIVDPAEVENVKDVFIKRKREWKMRQPLQWSGSNDGGDYPLLRVAGQYADKKTRKVSWPTMMSMRNVDAQCKGKITDLYLELED